MNDGGAGDGDDKMEEKSSEKLVLMWGYLPGATPQRSPILQPSVVRAPFPANGDTWKDVCGGGCGFAMAISESGKLITWGSTDDAGQSYVASGKHEEIPEPFPLPTEASIVKAAAGWAHCVTVTNVGEVYTWGWKECVPSGKVINDQLAIGNVEKESLERQSALLSEPGDDASVSPKTQLSTSTSVAPSNLDNKGGEESAKRRRISSSKQVPETSTSSDETLSALPCLVALSPGVRIATVAAGGRHTLALSDVGQVWGWGYGGEGQLGLGSRIRMVSSPHPVPCIEVAAYGKDRSFATPGIGISLEGPPYRTPGNYIKAIACGGRHSVVITDAGAVLTFGWGLYGQCGQGGTDDELIPACVSSLWGIPMKGVAAGLWHTLCVSMDGDVYAFGGNQFGQLGTGADQAETLPRLLDAPSLENKHVNQVSCGARHSSVITDDEKVFCWGWNKYGQLGLGDVIDRSIPSEVPIHGCHPKNVACGWWHTLALAESPT